MTINHEPENAEPVFQKKEAFVRRPLWLRVLLFVILLLLVSIGFYCANLITIDHYQNR